eukprot:4697965-Amphidinium_carterae.1
MMLNPAPVLFANDAQHPDNTHAARSIENLSYLTTSTRECVKFSKHCSPKHGFDAQSSQVLILQQKRMPSLPRRNALRSCVPSQLQPSAAPCFP